MMIHLFNSLIEIFYFETSILMILFRNQYTHDYSFVNIHYEMNMLIHNILNARQHPVHRPAIIAYFGINIRIERFR